MAHVLLRAVSRFFSTPPSGENKRQSSARVPTQHAKARAGDKITIQFIMTNVYAHASAPDAGVRYYVVREKAIGQKTVPALQDVTVEGGFNFDLKPKARIGARQRIAISEPGNYLLRVETIGARKKLGRESFAAIEVSVP